MLTIAIAYLREEVKVLIEHVIVACADAHHRVKRRTVFYGKVMVV
jgi:hypothetical protein